MKKLATLLLLIVVSFLGKSSSAQNTTCNAEFNIVYQTANTVQFNPVVVGNPVNTQHSWIFGDGVTANTPSPQHTYLTSGVFTAQHIITIFSSGTVICRDTFHRVIPIQSPNPTPCNLVANFTITPVTASPNTFHFTNTSTPLNNTDSIRWTFGDGTSSNVVNPTHTYSQSGTYNVCLSIQQRNPNGTLTNCIREICHTLVVQNPNPTPCNLVANFTWTSVVTSPASFTYHFQNTSVPLHNTDSIRWAFGDGTSSNQIHPNHTYTQPGTYTVCLRIQQRNLNGTLSNCIREVCHTIIVQGPTTCNLHANFTSTLVSTSPFTYHFQNTSTGLVLTDSIRWTFGDGTSSNQVSPNHTYTAAGTYNVCLRIQKRNNNGTLSNCVSEICHTIIVQGPTTCNLVANFTATQVAGTVNVVHFTNTSTPLNPADSIRWTFGDGTSSNAVHPTHTYLLPGTYTVCLRVQQRNPNGVLTNCIREICHNVTVQGSNTCNLVASFTITPLSATANAFHFENTSTALAATDSIRWTFGDGTSSNQVSPNHTYAQPGTYIVCLRIQKRNNNGTLSNCVREFCHTVVVPGSNVCNLVANFHFYRIPSSGTALPYLYHFVNTTAPLAPIDSIRWTFGDGGTSSQVNPNHAYAQPGTYTVCLRVIKRTSAGTLTNCISEVCHTLVVTAPNPTACNLQPYPNPVGNTVSVNVFLAVPQMIDVYIYNTSNILVKEKHQPGVIGNNIVTIITSDLLPGIYIMKVVRGNSVCYTTFIKL